MTTDVMEVVESVESSVEETRKDEPAPVKLSFGIKKKAESTFKVSTVATATLGAAEHSDEDEETAEEEARAAKRRKLTHLEGGTLAEDPDETKKSGPLVIDAPKELDWRVQRLLEQEKDGSINAEDLARLEILSQSNAQLAQMRVKKEVDEEAAGDGAEAIFVDAFKKDTEDADYSKVPIAAFGLALLRGCGWRDGEGIGKRPQVVPLRLPERRPKGLGLGAAPKQQEGKKENGMGEVVSQDIKAGSLVKITQGKWNGFYGKVESRDDDNARVYVKLALGGNTAMVSTFYILAVSAKEYERDSKCINKDSYEKEKAKIDFVRDKRKEKEERREKEGKRERKDRERERIDDGSVWCRADCIVRIISEKYKGGRHMDEKMRVVDAANRKSITLEDERGITHYNMHQSWLETVMPRAAGEKVMIVRGRLAGERAVMEEKDKERQVLHARLLSSQTMAKVSFDDACLYRPKMIEIDDDDEI